MIPLFEHYPALRERLPHVTLGEYPTPVVRLERLGDELGLDALYLKNDGLSGELYGGNKVRKLEFLLADALEKEAKEVLTFGYAGSNHALATAIYARRLRLRAISMLLPQASADYVRRNLLMSQREGAELHHHRNLAALVGATAYQLGRHTIQTGRAPYVIAAGGSSALGAVGFVNAGFELDRQISAGACPPPRRIYVAAGTMGTCVGLAIGLKAAGCKSRIVAVRVTDGRFVNRKRMNRLFQRTVSLLRSRDPKFPPLEPEQDDIELRGEFFGRGYAMFTEEAMEAVACIERLEGLSLECTYTGKALAALVADARAGRIDQGGALFWNTYSARDLSAAIAGLDYRLLPKDFHRYFSGRATRVEQRQIISSAARPAPS